MKTFIRKDGQKFNIPNALYEAIARRGLMEDESANPTNPSNTNNTSSNPTNASKGSTKTNVKNIENHPLYQVTVNALKNNGYVFSGNPDKDYAVVSDVISNFPSTIKSNEIQDYVKKYIDNSTKNVNQNTTTDNEIKDYFYNSIRLVFENQLLKVDKVIEELNQKTVRPKVQNDIKRYKENSNAEEQVHFEVFDRINEKYFNKNKAEEVSNYIVKICKQMDNDILSKMFPHLDNAEEIKEKMVDIINKIKTSGKKSIEDVDVLRCVMILRSVLFSQYKKDMNGSIKNQQNLDSDLPPEYVERTIKSYVDTVERILMNKDNNDEYVISDDQYMTGKEIEDEKDGVWNKFITSLNNEKPLNEWDDAILKGFLWVADVLTLKYSSAEGDNYTNLMNLRQKTYKVYSSYRRMYDKLDDYLNRTLINESFKEDILNNKFIEQEKINIEKNNESKGYDVFTEDIIGKIFKNYIQKSKKMAESFLMESNYFKGEFSGVKLGDGEKEISKENFEWFNKTITDALNYYYENINKLGTLFKGSKTGEPMNIDKNTMQTEKILDVVDVFLSYINRLCNELGSSQYLNFGLLEKFKMIFGLEYNKAIGKNTIKMKSNDHLDNFYKLMGRYPKRSDMEEYRTIYKQIQDKIEKMDSIKDSIKSSMADKKYYEPLDYFMKDMGGWFFKISPSSDPVLTVESEVSYGKQAKKFLDKCFAYNELCLLAKDKSAKGSDIASDIIKDTEITHGDICKLFTCIHINNQNLSSTDFRSMVFNLKGFQENYIIGQPYNMTRLTRQNYLTIYRADTKEFVGTLDFVSYNKLRDAIREFGNFSKFVDTLSSRKKPSFV